MLACGVGTSGGRNQSGKLCWNKCDRGTPVIGNLRADRKRREGRLGHAICPNGSFAPILGPQLPAKRFKEGDRERTRSRTVRGGKRKKGEGEPRTVRAEMVRRSTRGGGGRARGEVKSVSVCWAARWGDSIRQTGHGQGYAGPWQAGPRSAERESGWMDGCLRM